MAAVAPILPELDFAAEDLPDLHEVLARQQALEGLAPLPQPVHLAAQRVDLLPARQRLTLRRQLGHTHLPRDERIQGTRVLNPGALHAAQRYTVGLLDTTADTFEVLELDALP